MNEAESTTSQKLTKWGIYAQPKTVNGAHTLTPKGITITITMMMSGTLMLSVLFFMLASYIVGSIILVIGVVLTALTIAPSIKLLKRSTLKE